ncbi:bromo adjacent homology domain-containing 1 protein isoform X3 [Nannospalax galili]|uniref:bromo adjacent homology domain-containing 1 protein isoform X3 n=1 Tax=Nannospalax galili TaxID=1026970 RepID=UPI0004ED288C|nr:bromo adjacent homology domain-containing 1 protein isoform X3 [Nannospalax galili]
MTHTRRKSLPMLSSGPTGRQEPLQMEDSNMEQGAEDVEPSMPESPGHLTGRRKNYPLRKRSLVPEKPKACKVLLTRLENVAGPRSADEADELPPDLPKPPSPTPSSEDTGLVQPRKRRLASLNAEALNNLLLEREDTSSLTGTRRSRGGDPHRSRDRTTGGWSSSKKRPRLGDLGEGSRDLSPEPTPDEGARRDGDLAPKRLASLNAAAFLKLSQERELPLRPSRAQAEADGRSTESLAPKILRPKWAKVNGKNCPKARQGAGSGEAAGPPSWQEQLDEPWPSATPGGPSVKPPYQPPVKALKNPLGLRPHLPVLMGGQAALKPEPGRPGEESPAPKQELHQPSFPAPQLSPLPMPGNPADYSGLCGGPELTALGSFYLYCGQDGLQCGGYSPCPMLPEGKLSPMASPNEGLLMAPSSVPSGIPFQHPPWSSSRYCSSEDTGVNSYSFCGVLPLSLTHIGTTCGGCPYKMPFAAEGCRSLGQLEFPLPEAGHPASPAHPLLGCPVPSVPPAAEPIPHLQTPTSEPQTVARACPQSAKPPSGSKSGLRTGSSCRHTVRSKAARRPSHPKQTRAQRPRPRRRRRRRTNGWVPVGAACEKAVYVLDEPEPAIRKSYQAVERHGETIRVRDTVLLKSGPRKTSTPYVAKISALWENPESGELMMSLLWYYRPEHLQGGRSPSMHENEVFASRHQDQNSVACIEEKCYVLTFAEYCRFCAMAKRRGEGLPSRKTALVPPSADYSTPPHRTVPEDTDPELVFLCRHVYDFRHGRILKNPQ